MRRKISWTEGRTDRGKTVYPPPPPGSGGIINCVYIYMTIKLIYNLTDSKPIQGMPERL